jgi:multiple sugar transport system permease protein
VVFFQLVLGLISSFQQLTLPLLLAPTAGNALSAPPRATYLYVVHVYQQIFVYSRFGYGTALLWLLFVFITLLTVGVFKTARYWVYYEVSVEGGAK